MSHTKPLPPIGKLTIDEAKQRLEEGLYYEHPLYARWRSSWRRAELYDAGLQWLQKGPAAFDGPGYLSQWASIYYEPSDPNFIPTPVFNEGHGARVNESARIGRPNYQPKVLPKSESPNYRVKQSAKKATDLLKHRLKTMDWDKQAYVMYYHIPVYGGAWLKSEWEQRWDQTTMVPSDKAVKCPAEGCDFSLNSPDIPFSENGKAPWLGSNAVPNEGDNFKAKACPQCAEAHPLVPFQPTMEEASLSMDSLGRPMGVEQPLGDWLLTIRSPYDMHPKNLGFMTEPGKVEEWREIHIETLDWVALHYPDRAADVKPERPDQLAKYHPILGAPDVYGSILDTKIMKDCVRVMEWHRKPWMEKVVGPEGKASFRFNEGRSIVIANNVILLDAPYLMTSVNDPTKKVARVNIDYIPWEVMDGGRYLHGMSLWTLLFDPQDAANEIRSQAQSIRQRLAVPLYIALKSHNLEISMRDGVPGRFAFIDVDPEAPTVVPQLINNNTIDSGAWTELDDTVKSLQRYAGDIEVEKGQVPPNVEAAIAIKQLKEYAGERREPRIMRIKEALRRVWKHGLELMTAFYIEPREVSFEDEDGEEKWTMLHGLDIKGETSVTIESEADFDDQARNQELVLSLIDRKVLDPTQDPVLAREIARILEAPEGLFERQDIQKDGAQREYLRFKEEGVIPVVDPTLDDHLTHYQQHGIDAQSEYFRDLEEQGGWDEALKVLSPGWEQNLMMLGMMPGPPCFQEKIYNFWMQQLQLAAQPQIDPMTGIMVAPPAFPPPQDPEALDKVLRWRSHLEEHRLFEQTKQLQAMMQPTLAAPGSPAGPAGSQAVPEGGGAPPVEAPPAQE